MEELQVAGRSLSFRALNRNHEEDRGLKFPDNATLATHFKKEIMGVVGKLRVVDEEVIKLIDSGLIQKISIEQIPTLGESCDEISCEQHGVAFIGLALLDKGVIPGDERAEIKLEAFRNNERTLEQCYISNDQRTCKECTDDTACHACAHQVEQKDDCVATWISKLKDEHPDWKQDQLIAVAMSKCGINELDESWFYFQRAEKRSF